MQQLAMLYPIIQAPLAGGGDTPDLVAGVAEAGGLGFIGAAYLTPAEIAESARAVKDRTSRPFGINLFAPMATPPSADPGPALARLAGYYSELGLSPPAPPTVSSGAFDRQLAAALDSGAAAFSFTMGLLPESATAAIKGSGMYLMGTATTVREAVDLEQAGVDAIVAQGSEAGGHRGTFGGSFDAGMVGTMALVPQIVDAVRVPVIASGGIMDGRGIAAALVLGASAVQMGTAFLTSAEAGIPEAYKQAILSAEVHETRITRAFSGRPARGIVNRFMAEMDTAPDAILPFPVQNALTRALRSEAAKQGRAEFLSLWAGQGLGMARRLAAGELVRRLARETDMALQTVAAKSRINL
jgi:nitronate monooxygenase